MSEVIKIAFTGKAGSGKDFLANFLMEKYNFHRLSFSDQLKKIAKTTFPWMNLDYPPEQKSKPLNFNTGYEIITKSPRDIWMFFNQLKTIEQNIFVRMLSQEYQDTIKKFNRIVITDIRFWNEFNFCMKHDFFIIGIKPNKKIYKDYFVEKEIDEFFTLTHMIFYNNFDDTKGTLKQFDDFMKKNWNVLNIEGGFKNA